jgi:hypothetical protein
LFRSKLRSQPPSVLYLYQFFITPSYFLLKDRVITFFRSFDTHLQQLHTPKDLNFDIFRGYNLTSMYYVLPIENVMKVLVLIDLLNTLVTMYTISLTRKIL